MKLPRKQAAFARETIEQWKHDGLLADTQAPRLAETILVQPFDWRRLAKYSFWIALISIVSSVSAALSDQFLIDLLEDLFDAPAAGKCVGLVLLAAGLYSWGVGRRRQVPVQVYRNEAILFLGVC